MAKSPGGSATSVHPRPVPKGDIVTSTPPPPAGAVSRNRLAPASSSELAWYSTKRSSLKGSIGQSGLNHRTTAHLSCTPTEAVRNLNFPPKASSTPKGAVVKQHRRQSSQIAQHTPNGSVHTLSPIRLTKPSKPRLSFNERYALIQYGDGVESNGTHIDGDAVVHRTCQVVLEDFLSEVLRDEFRDDPKLNGCKEPTVELVRLEEQQSEEQLRATTAAQPRDLRIEVKAEVRWQEVHIENGEPVHATTVRLAATSMTEDGLKAAREDTPAAGRGTEQINKVIRSPSRSRVVIQGLRQRIRQQRHQQYQTGTDHPVKSVSVSRALPLDDSLFRARGKAKRKPDAIEDELEFRTVIFRKKPTASGETAREPSGKNIASPRRGLQRAIALIKQPRIRTSLTEPNQLVPRSTSVAHNNEKLSKSRITNSSRSRSSSISLLKYLTTSQISQSPLDVQESAAIILHDQARVRLVNILQLRGKPEHAVSQTKSPVKAATSNCKSSGRNAGSHGVIKTKVKKEKGHSYRLPSQLPPVPEHEMKYWIKYKLKHVAVSVPRLPL